MDQVGDGSKKEEEEESATEAIKRKYGLVVPEYIPSNRSSESTNKGPYRSVLDFESTEELQKAMLAMEDEAQFDTFLKRIAEGNPVQTVSEHYEKCSSLPGTIH